VSPIFADHAEPYGRLRTTTARVVAWNVWCHFGDWEQRYREIWRVLRDVDADLVAVVESWAAPGLDPLGDIARDLGYEQARAESWYAPFEVESGSRLLSRWPIASNASRRTDECDGEPGALFQHCVVDGPRGELDVFLVMLDWRPHRSDIRQRQVSELAEYVRAESQPTRATLVCGDFNAAPDTDEIRALTGRTTAAARDLLFYDAWEMCGDGDGCTWSNVNPAAATALLPNRRIDYILSAWPSGNGVGHPVAAALIGTDGHAPASDHYGVSADIRY
jgi:endonuclease/exonuclease/phosphatase family metal-dependent hydrolase